MRSRRDVLNYGLIVLLGTLLLACQAEYGVPLVYEYPPVTGKTIEAPEGTIVIVDQRTDKTLDKFIAPNVPDAIKAAMSRELAATGCMNLPGNPNAGCSPVQIKATLLESSVEVPGHGAKETGMVIAAAAGGMLGAIMAGKGDTDVVGEVKMLVHVRNVQTGADWEGTWTGATTTRIPKMYMDTPQMYSKALGGAVKDAMSHLPGTLARVGIQP